MPFSLSSWLKSLYDKDKFEVTLRIGIMCCLGFCLSVASIPKVVPPSQALMPGLLVAIFSQLLPTLMFTLCGAFPTILVLMVTVCIWSTALLATASVSHGCLLGVYSAFTLFMTTLYFGKHYSFTSGVASLYFAMVGIMSLSYLPLIDEKGLQAVGLMWTESGTENELAAWRNFLICVCWAVACVAVGILVPPWRTSREMITRMLFPAIFKQVTTVLSGEKVNVKALIKSMTSLKGGDIVTVTLFEPRVLHCGEDLITSMRAVAVATDEMVFRSLLVLQWKEGMTKAPTEMDSVVLQDSSTLLSDCGAALSKNSQAEYSTLLNFVSDKAFDQMAMVGSANIDSTAESASPEESDANFIYEQALQVRASTLTYLRAFHHGTYYADADAKQKWTSSFKRMIMFVATPLIPTMRLVTATALICQPKKWNFASIMWSLELSAGYIALFAMSLYWDAYANFRINPADDYVGPGKFLLSCEQFPCLVFVLIRRDVCYFH